VNIASIAGVLLIARRHGGRSLLVLAAAGIVLMSRSFAPESLHDLFNPSVALFPFALLVMVCWSLAQGEYRLAPLAVLLASFVVQCHLAFVLPAAGLLAVGAFGARRAPRRWALVTLAVFVVCWSAPIADEIAHRPGNLSLLAIAATSRKQTLGVDAGWRHCSERLSPPWRRACSGGRPGSPQPRRSGSSCAARLHPVVGLRRRRVRLGRAGVDRRPAPAAGERARRVGPRTTAHGRSRRGSRPGSLAA
jgi:hypothetical protein